MTRADPDTPDDILVRSALNGISPDHALVLRLQFLDGMPLKRIAAGGEFARGCRNGLPEGGLSCAEI